MTNLEAHVRELAAAFDSAPVGLAIGRHDSPKELHINATLAEMIGADRDDEQRIPTRQLRLVCEGRSVFMHDLPTTGPVDVHFDRDDGTRADFVAELHAGEGGSEPVRIGTFIDVTQRNRSRVVRGIVANAASLLASTLDYEETLTNLVRSAVPRFADWCSVDLVQEDGSLRHLAVANEQASRMEQLASIAPRIGRLDNIGPRFVIGSRSPQFFPRVTDHILRTIASDERQFQALRSLGVTSYICVPLIARGRALGSLTLVAAESGRCFDNVDLGAALEIASRAAVAIENARLYRESRERGAELEQVNRTKDEFFDAISHELRTPITTIYGNAALLRHRLHEVDEGIIETALSDVEEEAERLRRLVENMLVLARLNQGDRVTGVEPLVLGHLVERVVRYYRARPGFEITLSVDEDTRPSSADPTYIDQVLRNLISYAQLGNSAGAPVDIRVRSLEDMAAVTVGNRAPPSAYADLDTAFERNDEISIARSGAGIGLAAAKRIIEAHGGQISARTRNGGGNEITFTLPHAQEEYHVS